MSAKEIPIKHIDEEGEIEMSFLDHLEELRWRIIYSLIGLLIGGAICWIFIDFIMEDILLAPALKSGFKLQNLKPFGQLMIYFQVAIFGGIIISVPNLLYQLWKFIAPALKSNERKYILSIVTFSSICFLAGIAFAYFVMLPITLQFAATFGTSEVENKFALDEYFSILFSIILGAAVVFELPMISFFLSKLGILTPAFMRKYRRHALVAILVLAALFRRERTLCRK